MINKIHYAVEITTSYNDSIPSIGMDTVGVIRYITDGANTAGMTYENGDPVTEPFNTGLLTRNGISQASQKIDIISGGGFAYASSLTITITNSGALHKTILNTDGLHIVGSTMRLYTIIDGVFYSRWVGAVGSYEFDEQQFKFNGVDKHKINNEVIKNGGAEGYTYLDYTIVEENIQVIGDPKFIKNIGLNDSVSRFIYTNGGYPHWDMSPSELELYTGPNCITVVNTNNNVTEFLLYLNGYHMGIKVGQYVTFRGDDSYYRIDEVENVVLEYHDDDDNPIESTRITLDGLPDSIADFSQFYGRQEHIMKTDYKELLATITSETMYINVHSITIPTALNNVEYVMKNGKYIAIDDDCNEVLIEATDSGDVLFGSSIVTTITPSKIFTFRTDYGDEFNDNLELGKIQHLEELYDSVDNIPNHNNLADGCHVSDYAYNHYFVAEFDEDITDGYTPYTIVSAMVDSWENWRPFVYTGEGVLCESKFIGMDTAYTPDPPIGNWTPTAYNTAIWHKGDASYIANFFRSYEVEVYAIVSDNERGDVPILLGGFEMPNTRYKTGLVKYSGVQDILGVQVKSSYSTNLPVTAITNNGERYITTSDNCYSWKPYNDPTTLTNTFKGLIDTVIGDYKNTMTTTDGETVFSKNGISKLLYRIKPTNNLPLGLTNIGQGVVKIEGETSRYQLGLGLEYLNGGNGLQEAPIGINSLGLYKETAVDYSRLRLKVMPKDNVGVKTYPELLQKFTGSASLLPLKNSWYIGKSFSSEVNTFDEVVKLCKQGFTAGFSNRYGDVILTDFLNDIGVVNNHSDDLIIDKSLKGFKLSPLSKCYNDFTIKYDARCDKYNGEYGVHHVDEDEFPAIFGKPNDDKLTPVTDDYYPHNTYSTIDICSVETSACALDGVTFTLIIYRVIEWGEIPKYKHIYVELENGEYAIARVVDWCSNGERTCELLYYSGALDVSVLVSSSFNTNKLWIFDTVEDSQLWAEYVVGVDSYSDAKSLWEQAHKSYLLNRVVRKAAADYSNLEYAVDLDEFLDTNTGLGNQYAYDYFKMFIEWSTQQKLQVTYDIPITTDTIMVDIMSNVIFKDDMILPQIDEYGEGWITSLKLDPKKDKLTVELTFNTMFMRGSVTPACDTITETGYSTIDIIETGTNIDTITEGACNNG